MLERYIKILTWLVITAISVLLAFYISYNSLYKLIILGIWSTLLTIWVIKTPWPEEREDNSS